MFAELGEVTPDTAEKANIVNETAELLKNEESHRVKSQGLATLLKLGEYQRYVTYLFSIVSEIYLIQLCLIYFYLALIRENLPKLNNCVDNIYILVLTVKQIIQ